MLPIEPARRRRGRRPKQNRAIINGILWRLRCGAPLSSKALPMRKGDRRTAHIPASFPPERPG
ncbi:hypothetical protein [Novosphingobium mangrovi (ex Hu et al. 2023)]|uniref:hypothetical protein n=1 Tax=Novosphingobium mangrovi (ex Hu et al. 2023) TaxID=2930094 RepID=UPI003AF2A6FC